MANEAEDCDRSVAAKYRMCRVYGHAWDYTTVKRDKGEFIQGLRCMRCSILRDVRISALSGDRLGNNRYDYSQAPGYLFKSGGPLTPEERSELRLAEVRALRSVGRRKRRAG